MLLNIIESGMKLAVVIIFTSTILAWLQSETPVTMVGRYRGRAWLFIAISFSLFYGPLLVAQTWNAPMSRGIMTILTFGGLISLIVGVMYHQAARTLSNGGRRKEVRATVMSNVVVVLLCIAAVWVAL